MRISVLDIDRIQDERRKWAQKNFGDQTSAQMMMGITEEVGELAHHQLKMEQGIRGSRQEHMDGIKDSIGDIVMYLMGYCDTHGLNFSECVEQAWSEIQGRDWKVNPTYGKPGVGTTGARKDSPNSFEAALAQGEKRFYRGEPEFKPTDPAIADLRDRIQKEARRITDAPQA